MKMHKAIVPLYGITFYYSNDPAKVADRLGYDISDISGLGGFCIRCDETKQVGIHIPHNGLKGNLNVGTVAHESLHAAMFTGHFVGLEPTLTNHEEIAYLAGWFANKIIDFVRADARSMHK